MKQNKFLVFLKCKPSSHGFNKLVIKSKNTCNNTNKIIFSWIFCILKKMLNHAMYFFNAIWFLFEKLGHMELKYLNVFVWKKNFIIIFFVKRN